jgi:hypothetical protein
MLYKGYRISKGHRDEKAFFATVSMDLRLVLSVRKICLARMPLSLLSTLC